MSSPLWQKSLRRSCKGSSYLFTHQFRVCDSWVFCKQTLKLFLSLNSNFLTLWHIVKFTMLISRVMCVTLVCSWVFPLCYQSLSSYLNVIPSWEYGFTDTGVANYQIRYLIFDYFWIFFFFLLFVVQPALCIAIFSRWQYYHTDFMSQGTFSVFVEDT